MSLAYLMRFRTRVKVWKILVNFFLDMFCTFGGMYFVRNEHIPEFTI